MSLRLAGLLTLLAAVSIGVLAGGASARFQSNSVVPLFCTNDQIPANTELKLRIRWAVKNAAQIRQFLNSQKLTWTVKTGDGATVLAQRQTANLNPEYGDTTYWSAPVHQTGVDVNQDGKVDDIYYADYLVSTGVVLSLGQSVKVEHLLIANTKTDDGFGNALKAGQPLSSGTNCMVTGATAP